MEIFGLILLLLFVYLVYQGGKQEGEHKERVSRWFNQDRIKLEEMEEEHRRLAEEEKEERWREKHNLDK
jgi:hypothetical protein